MKNAQHPKNRVLFSVWVWLCYEKNNGEFEKENLVFLENAKIPRSQYIYISRFSPTVIIWASEDEIRFMKNSSLCIDITPYVEKRPLRATDEIILTQLGADSISGSGSPLFNSGEGYRGEGVVFGMISAERRIFEATSPQLQKALVQNRIRVFEYPLPPTADLHPSVVLSQMLGEVIEVDRVNYEGIVRNAVCYFATSEVDRDVLFAIEEMLSVGIRVINYSAGILYEEEYIDFDRQLDRLIRINGFLFVTVSGNRRTVTNPGKAWNVLTVGNLQTKASPLTPSDPPYFIWCKNDTNCSGYINGERLAHKPDVVAPGSLIPYITPAYTVVSYINTGTSFACPWVTGIAVQLIEKDSTLSHLAIKAIIALSSNREIISESFNPILEKEPFCRELTGFGLVNSERALRCADNARIFEKISENTFEIEETGSGRILAALAFDKSEGNEELSLFVGNLSANRLSQNLHVLEYTALQESTSIRVEGSAGVEFCLVVWKQ